MEQQNEISIELAAAIRNAAVWMSNAYSHERVKAVSRTVRNLHDVPKWNTRELLTHCNYDQNTADNPSHSCCNCGETAPTMTPGRTGRTNVWGHCNGDWKWKGNWENRDLDGRSCARLDLARIQVRAQFVSRNAGSALDLEHAQRRDFIPLRNSLFGDTERSGKFRKSAGRIDGSF